MDCPTLLVFVLGGAIPLEKREDYDDRWTFVIRHKAEHPAIYGCKLNDVHVGV